MKSIAIELIVVILTVNTAAASSPDEAPTPAPIHNISIPPTIQPISTTPTPTPTPPPTATVIYEPVNPESEITYNCNGKVTNDYKNCKRLPGFEVILAIAGIFFYVVIWRKCND